MAYPCDLPANMGNTDIFRAIYNKIGNSDISTGRIEEKLDIISDQLANVNDQLIVVNNNIEANTEAIKDISINVDIHSKDIQSITKAINKQTKAIENIQIHIDTSDLTDSVQLVATKVEDGFVKTVEAIKSIQPGPTPPVPPVPPRPVPPCPPPHPHPCPAPEPIFYPVPLGLPEPQIFHHRRQRSHTHINHNKCEYKHTEKKNCPKVFIPEEQRPNYETKNPNLMSWKVELYRKEREQRLGYKESRKPGALTAKFNN